MASVGIRRRVSHRTGRISYQVWWLLDDGSQGAETVANKDQARALAAEKRLQFAHGTWQGRRRGQLPFSSAARCCCASSSTPWMKARSPATQCARSRPQTPRRPRHGARPGQAPRAHARGGRPAARPLPLFWWDHVLTLLGTGLRFGEQAGLRRRRLHLDRTLPMLHVVDIRYQADRFGSGFKPQPKSDAGIR